jgi:hypothetical protein
MSGAGGKLIMTTKQRLDGGQKWIETLLVVMVVGLLAAVIATSMGVLGS